MKKSRIYIFGSRRHYNNFAKKVQKEGLEILYINEEYSNGISKSKEKIIEDFKSVYDKNIQTKGIIIFGRATVQNGIENIASAIEEIKTKYPELNKVEVLGPSSEGANIFNNKDATQRVLYENGILTPKTYKISKNGLKNKFRNIKFPVVLKPLDLSGGCGIKISKNYETLKEDISELNDLGINDLIISEFIKGIEVTYTVLRMGDIFLKLPVSYKKETNEKLIHPDAKVKLAGFYNGYDSCYSFLKKLMKRYSIYGLFSLQGLMVKNKLSNNYDTYFLEAATRPTGSTPIMSAALKGFDLYKTMGDWLFSHEISFSHERACAIQFSTYKHEGEKSINKLMKLGWVIEAKYEDLSKMPYSSEKRDRIKISFLVDKDNLKDRLKKLSGILNYPQYGKEVLDTIEYFKTKQLKYEDEDYLDGKWGENIHWKFYLSSYLPKRKLCSAVFGILKYQNKIILTKTRRGWELPGGHIEKLETIEEALRREMLEESGAIIKGYKIIGYRKIKSLKPIKNRDGKNYPFPISYIPYYMVTIDKKLVPPQGDKDEILDSRGYTFEELDELEMEINSVINILKDEIT